MQPVGDVVRQLKGESSHWYNSLRKGHLVWQEEYFAASVSASRLDVVRDYIRNQEEHHRHKTFAEEYAMFLKGLGLKPWLLGCPLIPALKCRAMHNPAIHRRVG